MTMPSANPSHERERALLNAALELPPSDWIAFLDRECGTDAALRQRLERLLHAHQEAGSFLDDAVLPRLRTALCPTEILPITEKPGDRIGRYKLLQQIGEGGCGVVYMAEQEEPVRRRVALKVIKLGMDTKNVIARFEAERQALALMDHPNIAKVLDAGATETGRPFFVMELVRGIKITDYCDQHNLSTRERLDLFIQVCHAIQHAHQKGIIHRDIKPSNILVSLHDGVPVPVVIDFGIAKATEQRLTDKTLFTAFEQFIGTPAYMSPEQAGVSGLDVDTRSDIYALGVLLYELLTGKTPFDSKELLAAGLDEMRRRIREQEPARPSTRLNTLPGEELTTTAKRRGTEPPKLIHLVAGDLDWIVMKCLEKDRTRRYETANGLAQDIERHLHSELVVARPPSTAYRVQKFVRRNKVMVTAGTAVAAALVLGVVVSTWQAVRATRAEGDQARLRVKAETNEQKALQAQADEAKQRQAAQRAQRQAEAQELLARQQAYAADMNLAQRAYDVNDLGLAWDLLNRYRLEVKSEVRNPKSEAERATRHASGELSTLNSQPSTDLRHWEWRYLWQLCQSDEIFTLCQEPISTSTVQISPDGKVLAVRRGDGQIALWDWAARRRLAELPLLAGDIAVNPFASSLSKDIDFLPFGRLLAIGSTDAGGRTDVVLWDADTGTERGRLPCRAAITSLAASPDGKLLAIFAVDRRVAILDVQSKQECASLTVSLPVWLCGGVVQFSPDGDLLAVGDNDGTIHVWQWRSGADLEIPPQPPADGIMALAWSPTEPLLASTGGYEGRAIRLWNPLTGKLAGELRGHADWIRALAFTANGQFLASASADRTVRVWRVADGTEFRRFQGHRDEVWTVAFLPDGKTLVSGDRAGTVRFWSLDATHRNPSHEELPEKVSAPPDNVLAFAPDSRTFVTACRDGRVRVWSTQPVRELEQPGLLGTNNYALDFSVDGRWLAVGDRAGTVCIWDWPDRRVLANLPIPPVRFGILAFSPRGRYLWAGLILRNFARAGRIWETATWRELPSPLIDYIGCITASVSPDEKLLAVSYVSGDIKLWSVPGGHLEHTFPGQAFFPSWLAFAPDGRTLAAANTAGFVQLWDVLERRPLERFEGHRNALRGPAFSSDGRRLAVAGGDSREALKLWDMTTLRELVVLPAKGLYFMRTAFSPDSNTLVAIDTDGVTHLWHAPSFAEIETVEREAKVASFVRETGEPGRRRESPEGENNRPVKQTDQ